MLAEGIKPLERDKLIIQERDIYLGSKVFEKVKWDEVQSTRKGLALPRNRDVSFYDSG